MGQYLLEGDAVNGKEGKLFINIDGNNQEVFRVKNLNVKGSFQEADFKVVGTRFVQKKTTGITLTGSCTLYYGDQTFLDIVQEYIKNGKVTYFSLQVVNDDPNTTIGKQVVALYNVKFSDGDLLKLDADSDWLDQQLNFTFTELEILNRFKNPDRIGNA